MAERLRPAAMDAEERRIGRSVTLAGSALTLAAVMLPPAIFFGLSHQRLRGAIEAEAETAAAAITQIIGANPDLWEFQQVRLTETLARPSRSEDPERRRLWNREGVLLAESSSPLAGPLTAVALPVYDAGVVVGQVEVARSLRPLLAEALLLAVILVPAAFLSFRVLRTVPLTALHRSQAALRKERDAAQRYLDVAGVAFVVVARDGRVMQVNRAGAELLGREPHAILGRDWVTDFVLRSDRARVTAEGGLAEVGEIRAIEYCVTRADGEPRTVAWQVTPVGDGTGAVLLSGMDVTRQRQLEEQVRREQKLRAVGQLAGGVAHDFNNALAAIRGSAALLRASLPAGSSERTEADEIIAASDRAASMVRGLATFGRRGQADVEVIDLVALLERSSTMLAATMGEAVAIETRLPPGPLAVAGDPVQLEMLLMNLASNARDAMPDGGKLVLGAARVDPFQGEQPLPGRDGPCAALSVKDTGSGMAAAVRDRAFEPFFTTKGVGKGSGLGLAIAYGIVDRHGGAIRIDSEPGLGTTVTAIFPLAQAPATLS